MFSELCWFGIVILFSAKSTAFRIRLGITNQAHTKYVLDYPLFAPFQNVLSGPPYIVGWIQSRATFETGLIKVENYFNREGR